MESSGYTLAAPPKKSARKTFLLRNDFKEKARKFFLSTIKRSSSRVRIELKRLEVSLSGKERNSNALTGCARIHEDPSNEGIKNPHGFPSTTLY